MARRPALLLQIPQPCHEDWDAMTPTTRGRHCASCEKVVVDFTRMTDGEVVAWIAKEGNKSGCGNFRPEQLNRPLFAAAQPASAWQRWALALLALLGWRSSQTANAQTQEPPLLKSIQQGVAKPAKSNEPKQQPPASNPEIKEVKCLEPIESRSLVSNKRADESPNIKGFRNSFTIYHANGVKQSGQTPSLPTGVEPWPARVPDLKKDRRDYRDRLDATLEGE